MNKVLADPVNSTWDPLETQNIAENSISTLSKHTLIHVYRDDNSNKFSKEEGN